MQSQTRNEHQFAEPVKALINNLKSQTRNEHQFTEPVKVRVKNTFVEFSDGSSEDDINELPEMPGFGRLATDSVLHCTGSRKKVTSADYTKSQANHAQLATYVARERHLQTQVNLPAFRGDLGSESCFTRTESCSLTDDLNPYESMLSRLCTPEAPNVGGYLNARSNSIMEVSFPPGMEPVRSTADTTMPASVKNSLSLELELEQDDISGVMTVLSRFTTPEAPTQASHDPVKVGPKALEKLATCEMAMQHLPAIMKPGHARYGRNFCPYCGANLENLGRFCVNCGGCFEF